MTPEEINKHLTKAGYGGKVTRTGVTLWLITPKGRMAVEIMAAKFGWTIRNLALKRVLVRSRRAAGQTRSRKQR